jgi:hypothetical protein
MKAFRQRMIVNNNVFKFGGARRDIMADPHDISTQKSVDEL